MTKIWLQFLGGLNIPIKKAACEVLSKADLAPCELGQEKAGSPGIIFFDEVTPSLYSHVRELSCNGLVRIFAVALRGDRLSVRDAWALLQAGASDVFAWTRVNHRCDCRRSP